MPLTHVGLIYGGLSSEHEVSLASARNVFSALDPEAYRVTLIRIDRTGRWHLGESPTSLLSEEGPADGTGGRATFLSPADREGQILSGLWDAGGEAARLAHVDLDVAFPMLHGQNGEDGAVQGLLKTLGIPYVGPDVLGSATCMDKDVAKRLLREAGIPVAKAITVRRVQRDAVSFGHVADRLGTPVFVKPANSGSSVGVSKVERREAFDRAVEVAFAYDNKILIEEGIEGREIECAVIGNEHPEASVLGEIVSGATFYTYDAKYMDADAARMVVPADLPPEVSDRIRALAVDAYTALGCEGMARVDFFVAKDYEVLVNEVNTIPGFTSRSMFPVMWAETGLPIGRLVDRLIQFALDRHQRDAALKTTL